MKYHITNLYNFNKEDPLVQKHHRFADAGRSLGFLEMGIFSYPVETDSASELSKRMDGIIASLESEDMVFIQLPTGNGYHYEQLLFHKCKIYKNTKIILVLHDMMFLSDKADAEEHLRYLSLYKAADAIIVPTCNDVQTAKTYGLTQVFTYNNISYTESKALSYRTGYLALHQNDFYIKKSFGDAIDSVFLHDNEYIHSLQRISPDEIHIGYGLHDKTGNYSVWVGVSMQSIIEHTDAPLCFHILHDATLNEQNRKRLLQVGSQNGNRIQFHLLDESLFSEKNSQMSFYTIGALFRIMLPELLMDLPKIIYLDADILAHRDIKELWDTNIDNYCLAAVPDADVVSGLVKPLPIKLGEVLPERYFNSGVIYMNLNRIREKSNMREEILNYLQKTTESDLPDQDALNAIYTESTLLLDDSWNCFVKPLRRKDNQTLTKSLYHFVGTRVLLYSFSAVDYLYYETTNRTPWANEECKKQINHSLFRLSDRLTQLECLISQLASSPKKHIFYGVETGAMKNLYQLLSIHDDDYRVLEEPIDAPNCILPCKKLSAISEEKENFIVFVLPEADNGKSIENLEKLGLKNGKDFFVIPRILPYFSGGYV